MAFAGRQNPGDGIHLRAEELLAKGMPADTDAYLAMEAALRRSNLRLEAARRYRGSRTRMPKSES